MPDGVACRLSGIADMATLHRAWRRVRANQGGPQTSRWVTKARLPLVGSTRKMATLSEF